MTDLGNGASHGPAKCGAKKRQQLDPDRIDYCDKPAGWGTDHPGIGACRLHGGNMANHRKAAELEQARRAVALFGGRRDIHPAEALLELVGQKAMEVQYWRAKVAEVEEAEESLTFGVTRIKDGGDDAGTTSEAKPHIALSLLHEAERDLASYAAAALKAGVDERMVQLAQSTAGQFRRIVSAILDDPRLALTVDRSVVDTVVADALQKAIEQ